MIITIQKVEQQFTRNGDEYKKVIGISDKGQETTKSVFNKLQEKWGLLVEGAILDFKMEKKGQFWNVADINPVGQPIQTPTPDATAGKKEPPMYEVTPQEHGIWMKELGEWFRLEKAMGQTFIKETPQVKVMKATYWAELSRGVGVEVIPNEY